MNKLVIHNGGMPFEGDDLTFMQEAMRSGFFIMSHYFTKSTGFNDRSCIMRGVNLSLSGVNINYSNGWVFINGEPCELLSGVATNAVGNEAQYWIEIEEFADPAGTQPYADLVTKDSYMVRRAKVTFSGSIPSVGAMRFDLLNNYRINAVYVPSALLAGYTSPTGVQIRKSLDVISFRGLIVAGGSSGAADTFMNIADPAFRPPHDMTFIVGRGLVNPPCKVTIQTDGTVSAVVLASGDPAPIVGDICLDSIHYTVN
jgi:hypothetical protein